MTDPIDTRNFAPSEDLAQAAAAFNESRPVPVVRRQSDGSAETVAMIDPPKPTPLQDERLDESLRVDGELVMDPHRDTGGACYECGVPYAGRIRADIPHVWDVDGRPRGVRHELVIEGGSLVVRDAMLDEHGAVMSAEERRIELTTAVHALINMSDGELRQFERRLIVGTASEQLDDPERGGEAIKAKAELAEGGDHGE